MPPSDDRVGGGAGSGASGPQDLDTVMDVARTLASLRGAPGTDPYTAPRDTPSRSATGTAVGTPIGAAAAYPGTGRADVMRSHGLPVGLTVPSIQLAHALELLNRRHRRPGRFTLDRREPVMADAPFETTDTYPVSDPEQEMREDAEEARRLVADALASLAGSAGLSVPMGALAQGPAPTVVDPEVEAAFIEFDLAHDAWMALPPGVETWQPHPAVDRYLAAEDAVLSLADASQEVLSRQAGLLLDLADEIAEQMGPSAANAIANVAQALLLRLRL